MENILVEKKKRFANKHQKNEPFYFGKGVYVPIGQFLLLKKNDGEKIELFELGDNSEIVGEQLSKSLEIISKLGLITPSTWKDISDKLLEAHTIGGCENGKYFSNFCIKKYFNTQVMCPKIYLFIFNSILVFGSNWRSIKFKLPTYAWTLNLGTYCYLQLCIQFSLIT